MGYTTKFDGRFVLDEPLTAAQVAEMQRFVDEDHRDEYGTWSAYCQWVPRADGTAIEWDGGEKFYDYVPWLERIIERFLKPWGRVLSGSVAWQGESGEDQGVIHVKENRVQAVRNIITKPDPAWRVERPEPKW
jgi:hypothetical protein